MKTVKNFARFYAILKNFSGDHNEIKLQVVRSFTGGRTTSLREMSPSEYNTMCDALEQEGRGLMSEPEFKTEIKRHRSAVLKRIQKLGIDTTDWSRVDEFCLNSRIAGKVFRALTIEELKALIPRLEAIQWKYSNEIPADPLFQRVAYSYDEIEMIKRALSQLPS